VNVDIISLNSDCVPFAIDLNAYGSRDTPEVFPVSAKEGIGDLRVIKDDLLYNCCLWF
jgi:hypothetical protein